VSTGTAESDDPYANLAASYDRLVEWGVAQQWETPRENIADFLQDFWKSRARPVRRVLEICCGTGLMLSELARRGYTVTGLDRSPAMLERARARLGPGVTLIRAELPHVPAEPGFDAVISAAGGLNYLSETRLGVALASVARVLPPEGTFVFDLFGAAFYERFFVPSQPRTVAVELEDVSYIWTFTAPEAQPYRDMRYTQFRREPGMPADTYSRSRDLHRYYPVTHDTVRSLAAAAGFQEAEVTDTYTSGPTGPGDFYDIWTLVRAA
jgi:SAM-dependent methyltransferase